MWCPATIAGRV